MKQSGIHREQKKQINTEKKAQKQSHGHVGSWHITERTSEMNEARTNFSVTDTETLESPYGKK